MEHARNDAGQVAPVYLVFNGELLLEASVKDAWPHVINYASWQNYSLIQNVSGRPGEEGEIVLLKKEEAGIVLPPYYARTVKLEPERRVIWKVFSEEGTPTADFFGIVEFQLLPAAGGTRFVYDLLYEFRRSYEDESELEAFRRQQYRDYEAVFSTLWPKLRNVVARRTA